MAATSYDALLRGLKKGEIAPVYYLYGPEDVLKDDAARAIVDRALDPSARDFNFDQRSAGDLDAETFYALCQTVPMLSARRAVVVRNVEAWRRKPKTRAVVVRYLERPSPETVVVLVQGASEEAADAELARRAVTVHLESLPPERALRWLTHRAEQLGLALPVDAAEHLVRSVGSDLGALSMELQKLVALPEGTPVTPDVIGDLVGVRHGQTIFDWRDLVLETDPGRAVRLLDAVLAQPGSSGVKLVSLLGTTFVGVGIARSHYDRNLRGRGLEDAVLKAMQRLRPSGVPGWTGEARRWSAWAASWPASRLREALRAALRADQALKNTALSSERAIVADLVMRLAIAREAAA